MTATNNLEISGILIRNPLSELFVEIAQLKLNGSLRISNEQKKIIVYFDKGKVVFAVSNSRKHRLFEVLLNQNQISKETLTKIENFTNDLYLAKSLVQQNIFTKENIDLFISSQLANIIKDAIIWDSGEWTFSSLARIKEGICFQVNINPILFEYAENVEEQKILARFKSFDEEFRLNSESGEISMNLSPQEGFIFSRMGKDSLTIDDLRSMSGLPGNEVMVALYRLWLGGFIQRYKWNPAFKKADISKINSAALTLKTSALSVDEEQQRVSEEKTKQIAGAEAKKAEAEAQKKAKEEKIQATKEEEIKISLEEYLTRIENAATHYDVFGVTPEAELSAIKTSYFSLAKQFHPDLFHNEIKPELQKKIQHAFTELAQAYDTLRDEEAREVYDFKLRKILEQLKENATNEQPTLNKEDVNTSERSVMANENFEKGYDLLMNHNYYDALPFFGRAVHIESDNPRYHAFYGKALSFDKLQRHKAEAELQTAVKLDPTNTIYRIMLAELFIEIGLTARAKGELQRLLSIAPDNKEAQSLLDSLGEK